MLASTISGGHSAHEDGWKCMIKGRWKWGSQGGIEGREGSRVGGRGREGREGERERGERGSGSREGGREGLTLCWGALDDCMSQSYQDRLLRQPNPQLATQ